MTKHICEACGTQFPDSRSHPPRCPICEDERQYIPIDGQRWTTIKELRSSGHENLIGRVEPKLYQIITEPSFAIGQRAFLLQSKNGNVLWDCVSFIDKPTVEIVAKLGGIRAIAISHPHYYSSMLEWSEAFNSPIYINEQDRQWVMRPSSSIVFWKGDVLPLFDGLKLLRLGGHFDGGTVLHWPQGVGGKGAILSGDILQVVPDRRWMSFMYSYPNLIPLSARAVRRICKAVLKYKFERVYGAFEDRQVMKDGMGAVRRSMDRYIAHLSGALIGTGRIRINYANINWGL